MTSPLQILPAEVRGFAQDQMSSAGGFMAAPAPPSSPDDSGDDPTKAATGDFTDGVHRARSTLKQRSDRHADGMTTSANLLEAQDEQNAQNVSAVSPKDQMPMLTGAAKDLLGIGTGAFKDISGVFTSTLQALTAAGGSALQAGVGAGSSALGAAVGAGAKLGGHADVGAGAGAAAPIAGAGGSDDDKRRAQTHPAAASGTPAPPGATPPAPGGAGSGYVHPQDPDHDTAVQPAGMAMPGRAAGLGGSGGLSGAPVGKVSKARIVTVASAPAPVDDEPATGPIDTKALQRAVASI